METPRVRGAYDLLLGDCGHVPQVASWALHCVAGFPAALIPFFYSFGGHGISNGSVGYEFGCRMEQAWGGTSLPSTAASCVTGCPRAEIPTPSAANGPRAHASLGAQARFTWEGFLESTVPRSALCRSVGPPGSPEAQGPWGRLAKNTSSGHPDRFGASTKPSDEGSIKPLATRASGAPSRFSSTHFSDGTPVHGPAGAWEPTHKARRRAVGKDVLLEPLRCRPPLRQRPPCRIPSCIDPGFQRRGSGPPHDPEPRPLRALQAANGGASAGGRFGR